MPPDAVVWSGGNGFGFGAQRGGKAWEQWNESLKDALMFSQVARGRNAGSWPAVDGQRGRADRIRSTAMAVLTLQVYYKYPILSN